MGLIVGNIIVQAILNSHVNILEHFFTQEAFIGAPDLIFEYFIKAITHNANINVVIFFVQHGLDIRQNKYQALRIAIDSNHKEAVKYFCKIEPNIFFMLTESEKRQFNVTEITEMNQFIGLNKSCNIYYDDIEQEDKYFQCENKNHYFKEIAWKEYTKKKCDWTCPFCYCSVQKILFNNK